MVREKIALPNDVEIVDFAIFIDNCGTDCEGCISYVYDPVPGPGMLSLNTGDKLVVALNHSAEFFSYHSVCGNETENYCARIEVESGKSQYDRHPIKMSGSVGWRERVEWFLLDIKTGIKDIRNTLLNFHETSLKTSSSV